MNTLEEERYIRAERQRKQDLYRLMLDQQISERQNQKYQPSTDQYLKQSSPGSHDKKDHYDSEESSYRNRYFPIINQDKKTQPIAYRPVKLSSINKNSDQDKTQIYLSNCEQIIKNLRQLKRKKIQKETASHTSEPLWPNQNHNYHHDVSVQYFPRNHHFTSQGTPYNKNVPQSSNLKHKTKERIRTLQDSEDVSLEEKSNSIQKKNFQLRKRPVPVLGNKGYSLDKYTFSNKFQDRKPGRSDTYESETPSGLKESDKIHHETKISPHKNVKVKAKFKEPQSSQNECKDLSADKKSQTLKKNSEKQRSNPTKYQSQLSECLIQLTKFLKMQNQQKGLRRQSQVVQNGREQVVLQTSINPENPVEERADKNSKRRVNSKNDQSQRDDKQVNFNSLKVKTIEALKQVNKKSQQLANMASRRSVKVQPRRSNSPISSYSQNPDQNNSQLKNHRKIRQAPEVVSENQKPLKSKQFKKIFSIQQQYSLLPLKDQIQQPQLQKQNKNHQLISLLMNQLQKQGDQNRQLSYCLKELTTYLKDQNQEMETLKNSRQETSNQNINPPQTTETHPDLNEIEEQEEQEEIHKLQNHQKIQKSVLNSLKKARMKGSVFKEKIQNFRKQHQKMNLFSQKHKKQKEIIHNQQHNKQPREQPHIIQQVKDNETPENVGNDQPIPADSNQVNQLE